MVRRAIDTALLEAAQRGSLPEAIRGLDAGADVSAVSDVGSPGAYTPLMLAVLFGHAELAEKLLERGADPSMETRSEPGVASRTVLSVAVGNGRTELVKLLLQYGAAVNGRNDLGQTALSLAKL